MFVARTSAVPDVVKPAPIFVWAEALNFVIFTASAMLPVGGVFVSASVSTRFVCLASTVTLEGPRALVPAAPIDAPSATETFVPASRSA